VAGGAAQVVDGANFCKMFFGHFGLDDEGCLEF
jgi:hypothetical protein